MLFAETCRRLFFSVVSNLCYEVTVSQVNAPVFALHFMNLTWYQTFYTKVHHSSKVIHFASIQLNLKVSDCVIDIFVFKIEYFEDLIYMW